MNFLLGEWRESLIGFEWKVITLNSGSIYVILMHPFELLCSGSESGVRFDRVYNIFNINFGILMIAIKWNAAKFDNGTSSVRDARWFGGVCKLVLFTNRAVCQLCLWFILLTLCSPALCSRQEHCVPWGARQRRASHRNDKGVSFEVSASALATLSISLYCMKILMAS